MITSVLASENFIKISNFLFKIKSEIAFAIAAQENSQKKLSVLTEILIKTGSQIALISETLKNKNQKEINLIKIPVIEFHDRAINQVLEILELQKNLLKTVHKIETETNQAIHEIIQIKNKVKDSENKNLSEKLFQAATLFQTVQESSEEIGRQLETVKIEEIGLAIKKSKEAVELIEQEGEVTDLLESAGINLNSAFQSAQILDQIQARIFQELKQIERQFKNAMDFISV